MTPRTSALVEYGPLGVFFVTFWVAGIFPATAAIMAATAAALAYAWIAERRVPKVPLVSGVLLMVFGGLTLWLQDETFFKMKPTFVYLLFAAVLFIGLALRRPLLKPLLGQAWQLTDAGWRILTRRFGVFFLVLAGLNELVWRTQTTDLWVTYKVFGTILLIFVFTAAQLPMIQRHQAETEDDGAAD